MTTTTPSNLVMSATLARRLGITLGTVRLCVVGGIFRPADWIKSRPLYDVRECRAAIKAAVADGRLSRTRGRLRRGRKGARS